jgi:hypothetical protein
MARGGRVISAIKATRSSVPRRHAHSARSSRILMTSHCGGRRPDGEGSGKESILPPRLPSAFFPSVFRMSGFVADQSVVLGPMTTRITTASHR